MAKTPKIGQLFHEDVGDGLDEGDLGRGAGVGHQERWNPRFDLIRR